ITRFIEGRGLRLLMRGPSGGPGRLGWKVLHVGSSTVLSVLERLTGAQLLRDIGDFLRDFEGMYAGFAARADAVRELLRSDDAAFVVVAAPLDQPVQEAIALAGRLREDDLPLAAVVLNRIRPAPPDGVPDLEDLAALLAGAGAADPAGLAARAAAQLAQDRTRAAADRRARDVLAEGAGADVLVEVPELTEEPVEVEGLARVAAELTRA
ncbi:MAG TPA: hypothetical protein VNT51_04165, partial [Miltoncostaeaceae bacterium]|nr:hypothetical protein [Miltoncostaeaceae bacterium]